jgi:hypothetical protein
MNVDLRAIGTHVATLVWVALRSFLATVIVLAFAGFVLGALSYYFVRDHHWGYGVAAVVLALVEAVVIGVILGGKRALAMAAIHGFGSLRLGGKAVRVIFERMLGVTAEGEARGLGAQLAAGLDRVPLAQAEHMLSDAVRGVTGDAERGGWMRAKIQRALLLTVRKFSLARFRAEGATQGSVDLPKVKQELEKTIDDVIAAKLRRGLRLTTWLVAAGLPLLVAVQTWIIMWLVQYRSQ